MSRSRFQFPLLVWAGWVLVVIFLRSGPAAAREALQSAFQETVGLALNVSRTLAALPQRSQAPEATPAAATESELERLRAENHQLMRLAAQLREELDERQQIPALPPPSETERLLQGEMVPAIVLGRPSGGLHSQTRLLVSVGTRQGLVGEELALTGPGILIDRGEDFQLKSDQLTVAGRSLYGRTARVGRWTTLVQPVTDLEFRTAARIIRQSPLGPLRGPRGILRGTGTACRLDEVPSTEAVAIGDFVYTDDLVTPTGEPVYCGRVTRAEVGATASHWTIDVTPRHAPGDIPARLHVLRVDVNPQRTSQTAD